MIFKNLGEGLCISESHTLCQIKDRIYSSSVSQTHSASTPAEAKQIRSLVTGMAGY